MLLLLIYYFFFLLSVYFCLFFIFAVMFYFANYHQVYSDPLLSFLLCILLINSIQFFIDYFVPFCCFIVIVSFSDCHCCVKLGIL